MNDPPFPKYQKDIYNSPLFFCILFLENKDVMFILWALSNEHFKVASFGQK